MNEYAPVDGDKDLRTAVANYYNHMYRKGENVLEGDGKEHMSCGPVLESHDGMFSSFFDWPVYGTDRSGKQSQYSFKNVCIVAGGRSGLTRVMAAFGHQNAGYFVPG